MGKKDDVMVSMKEALDRWEDPNYVGDPFTGFDWRSGVYEALYEGDTRKMRREALPSVQAEVVRLALEAKSEQTRLSAAQFVLAQEGEGAVQKVEQNLIYDKLPEDQLVSLVSSRLQDLRKLAPGFDVGVLLEGVKDGEKVYAPAGAPGVEFEENGGEDSDGEKV